MKTSHEDYPMPTAILRRHVTLLFHNRRTVPVARDRIRSLIAAIRSLHHMEQMKEVAVQVQAKLDRGSAFGEYRQECETLLKVLK